MGAGTPIEALSAVTLSTRDMARSVRFYRTLGFHLRAGGERDSFTTFAAGSGALNLTTEGPDRRPSWWGRVVLFVDDVDALHARAVAAGLRPEFEPRDGPWGERHFHILDPDGHELSFARPI